MMHPSADIRGLLQYVPQFRGKIFVLDIDWASQSDAIKAEVLMDLVALQSIGVKLVLSMSEAQAEDFYDYSCEVELRVSSTVKSVDSPVVEEVLNRGQAVLVNRQGELLDDGLIALAIRLHATKMLLVSDKVTIKGDDGETLKFIHVSKLQADQGNYLLSQAAKACSEGVSRVHLLDGNIHGVIVDELFSTEGVGTMIYRDSYRAVRQLEEDDISEMLSMIGRSVRNTHLVPRTYEEVRDRLGAYYVMEVDENVVGCVALYEYSDCAEVACLYVKRSHEGIGYGAEMVEFLHEIAREKGIKKVFALSNRAAEFFQQRLGYSSMKLEDLPDTRYQLLLKSGRNSQAFTKDLT